MSFELEGPFFCALLGDNGTGKSTFLKALMGDVDFEGDISEKGFDTIGLLPQSQQLIFDLSVEELVVMGLYTSKSLFDNYSSSDYDKVKIVLERVGGSQLYGKMYHQTFWWRKTVDVVSSTINKRT